MRKLILAVLVLLPFVGSVPLAQALPSTVDLRIEGKEETLFEGRVPASIENIKASSDSQDRACDGVNELDPQNTAPGITPTLASVEAMESIGETFDGKWYDGFDDYFITRWGPDAQEPAADAYWGILVNEVYTNVGGCQYQLDEDDEALWVWNAFAHRPTLALFPEEADYTNGPRPTRAVAEVNQPFKVEVAGYADGATEGVPCQQPSRDGSTPYSGATVAPVSVNPQGFQRVQTGSAEAVRTDSTGKASITFHQTGIHRIKATVGSPGSEGAVRSNGLEVCVRAAAGECGGFAPPPSSGAPAACRAPTPSPGGGGASTGASSPPPATGTAAKPVTAGTLRLSTPRVDRAKLAAGRLTVGFKVLEAGPGIRKWTISSLAIGKKRAGWVTRAAGATKTEATFTLPRGYAYRLRFEITDEDGESSTTSLGKVRVPEAPRGRGR